LNLWTGVIQSSRVAATVDFRCNILHTTYFHRNSIGGDSVVGLGGGMLSNECYEFILLLLLLLSSPFAQLAELII